MSCLDGYGQLTGAVTVNELPGNFPEGSDMAAFPCTYTITK